MSFHPFASSNAEVARILLRKVTGPTPAEATAGVHVLVGAFFPLSADTYVHPTLAGFTAFAEPTIGDVGADEDFVADGVGFIEVGYVNPGYISKPGFNYLGYETVKSPEWRGEYSDAPFGKLGSSGMNEGIRWVNPGYINKPGFNGSRYSNPRQPQWRGTFSDRPFGNLGSSGLEDEGIRWVNPGYLSEPGFNGERYVTPGRHPSWRGTYSDRPFGNLGSSGMEDDGVRWVNPGYISKPGFNGERYVTPGRHPSWRGTFSDRPFGNLGSSGMSVGAHGEHRQAKRMAALEQIHDLIDQAYAVGKQRLARRLEKKAARIERHMQHARSRHSRHSRSGSLAMVPTRRAARVARLQQRGAAFSASAGVGAFSDGTGTPIAEINGFDNSAVGAFSDVPKVGIMYRGRDGRGGRILQSGPGRRALRDAEIEADIAEWDRQPTYGKKDTFIGRNLRNDVGTQYQYYLGLPADTTAVPVGAVASEEQVESKAVHAALALRNWAEDERIPVLSSWKSSDGSAHGHLYQLGSERDRVDLADQAKKIAGHHKLFYKFSRYSDDPDAGFQGYKVFFTDDPAVVEVDIEDAAAAGIEVGRAFARPARRTARVTQRLAQATPGSAQATKLQSRLTSMQTRQATQQAAQQSRQATRQQQQAARQQQQAARQQQQPPPQQPPPQQPPPGADQGYGDQGYPPAGDDGAPIYAYPPDMYAPPEPQVVYLPAPSPYVPQPQFAPPPTYGRYDQPTFILPQDAAAQAYSYGVDGVSVGYVRPRPGVGPDDLGTYGRFMTYGRGSNFQYPL